MMKKSVMRTKRELFDYAFTMLEWVINEERMLGNVVGSRGSDGTFQPLEAPPVTRLREK